MINYIKSNFLIISNFLFFLIFYLIFTNVSLAQNWNKEKFENFPKHDFALSKLRSLKIPEDYVFFINRNELQLFHSNFGVSKRYLRDGNIRIPSVWNMDEYLDDCEIALSNFDTSWQQYENLSTRFIRCKTVFSWRHFQDTKEGIAPFENILLTWAKTKSVEFRKKNGSYAEKSDQAYAATMLIGDFSLFYSVYYDDFNFTEKQRQLVNEYLKDWLINNDISPPTFKIRCVLDKPELFELPKQKFKIYADYCGSNRWRMGLGAIYLALRLKDQDLFVAGNRHIEINLASIDSDGIYMPWARKGSMALSYTRQLPDVLTMLSLAYESVGYDFYEHKTPHGKKINQVFEAFFENIYHPENFDKYASKVPDFGYTKSDLTQERRRRFNEFKKLPIEEKWEIEMIDLDLLVSQSQGFIKRYKKEWISKLELEKYINNIHRDHIALFNSVTGIALYEAANLNISKMLNERNKKIDAQKNQIISSMEKINIQLTNPKHINISSNVKFSPKIKLEILKPDNNIHEIIKASISGKFMIGDFNLEDVINLPNEIEFNFDNMDTLVSFFKNQNYEFIGIRMTTSISNILQTASDEARAKCGPIAKPSSWIVFVLSSKDSELINRQNCHAKIFKNYSEDVWITYKLLALISPAIQKYLITHEDNIKTIEKYEQDSIQNEILLKAEIKKNKERLKESAKKIKGKKNKQEQEKNEKIKKIKDEFNIILSQIDKHLQSNIKINLEETIKFYPMSKIEKKSFSGSVIAKAVIRGDFKYKNIDIKDLFDITKDFPIGIDKFDNLTEIIKDNNYQGIGIRMNDKLFSLFSEASEIARKNCGRIAKPSEWLVILLSSENLEKLKIQKCHAETFKAHSDQTWIAYKIIALSGPSIKNYILSN